MYGGEIRSNTASKYGGGVYDIGSFTMSGGTISGNNGGQYGGGGVYVWGSFTMTGGEISGNQTQFYGGGVDLAPGPSSVFQLSGAPVIVDNGVGNQAAGNVYVSEGKKITITGALTECASVGVGMESSGVFTRGFLLWPCPWRGRAS